MTVRWFEGFEHHGTSLTLLASAGWNTIDSSGAISTTQKRTGTYSFRLSSFPQFIRNTQFDPAEIIGGAALGFFMTSNPITEKGFNLFQFRNEANRAHISVKINPLGQFRVYYGREDGLSQDGTLIGTSTDFILAGNYYHIECKVKIAGAPDGYVKIRVNGRVFYELTGVATDGAVSGTDAIASFALGHFDSSEASPFGANNIYIDDIAVWDQVVDAKHDGDFIGQHGVYYLPVDLDGAHSDWLKSSGVDGYALLSEIASDEDGTYIYSDLATQVSSFSVATPPANVADIECVAVVGRLKKTENGDGDVKLGVRTVGATESYDSDFTVTPNYYTYYALFPINPQTSGSWNPAQMPEVMVQRTL